MKPGNLILVLVMLIVAILSNTYMCVNNSYTLNRTTKLLTERIRRVENHLFLPTLSPYDPEYGEYKEEYKAWKLRQPK